MPDDGASRQAVEGREGGDAVERAAVRFVPSLMGFDPRHDDTPPGS